MTIRVLHVLDELRASGVEQQILAAAEKWRTGGISTSVVATGQRIGPAQFAFLDAGIEVHHVPYRPRPGYVRDLASLARRKSDVVQFHTERAFIHSELACRMVGCSVIHSPCTVMTIGGLWRMRRIVQRWLARRAGVIMIATSDSVLWNERSCFRNPSRLIRNFIDTERFVVGDRREAKANLGVDADTLVFCSVGNCLDIKNHRAMLEALSQWGGDRENWLFLHAGQEIVPGERELARELGIADRCRFLGLVEEPESILQGSDVFLMTSLSEGLGNAAIEAAACGLVLVLTDVTGLRDLRGIADLATWTETDPTSMSAGIGWSSDISRGIDPDRRCAQHLAINGIYGSERGIAEYAALYVELGSGRHGR